MTIISDDFPATIEEARQKILADARINPDWAERNEELMKAYNISPVDIKQALDLLLKVHKTADKLKQLKGLGSTAPMLKSLDDRSGKLPTIIGELDDFLGQVEVQDPPEIYAVNDLRGSAKFGPINPMWFKFCGYHPFDPKFFENAAPLHSDFEQNLAEAKRFKLFVTVVIVAMVLFFGVLFVVMISLGNYFNWTVVGPMLVLVGVGVCAFAYSRVVNSKLQLAWRRYASWVYKTAEVREVGVRTDGVSRGGDTDIYLQYPNGYTETVVSRFKTSPTIFSELNTKAVMRRDRTKGGAAVIIEVGQVRIWCVPK